MAANERSEVPQGTLDLLILKMLALAPMHGYGLTQRLEQVSRGTFQVNPGSLFPALHQMEEAGWIAGTWGTSENNRRAKFYAITAAGRRQLKLRRESWRRVTGAIDLVLEEG